MPSYVSHTPMRHAQQWMRETPCPPDEDGAPVINDWIWKAALVCGKQYRLPDDELYGLIESNMTRRQKGNEVERAIRKAKNSVEPLNKKKILDPIYDPDLLVRYAGRVPQEITDDWLAEVSPECVLDMSPSDFLSHLYEPGESVCIVTPYESKKAAIWAYGDASDSLDTFTKGCEPGAWFLSNPVTGTCIDGSWRSEANVTSRRYAVLESDCAPDGLWLRILVQIPLPIAAIYTSGGKSTHALFRVDAESKQDWDEQIRYGDNSILSQLVPVGADKGALKAVQLTRLPGCMREEKGRMQRLLYLNSSPERKPIYET